MADIVEVIIGNVLRAGGSVLVIDDLTSTNATAALSANQGKVLSDMIEAIEPGGGAVESVNGEIGVVVLSKADIGLSNVDNTADSAKPVSSLQQTALNLKANTSSLATVATSGAYTDLSGKPTLSTVASTGAYSDLSGKPTLSTVAGTGAYSDLTGKPVLATVATSGSFADLTNKPTYTVLASLPGSLAGYVDGSEIVVTG